jgi:Zn-dependent peptidase ImmA (M78 family)
VQCRVVADAFLVKTGAMKRGKLPVDVETAAQRYGIRVHVISGISQKHGTKAVAFKKMPEDRFEILVDQYHYENNELSAAFSIAEVIGHILIHSDIFGTIRTPEERVTFEQELSGEDFQRLEMQAKRVASNLLLPSELLDPYVLNWAQEHIQQILSDRPANEKDLADFMASKLGPKLEVSKQIVQRGLERWTPEPLVARVARVHGIHYLNP